MKKLKPCPLCGGIPTLQSDFKTESKDACRTAFVKCTQCHCTGSIADSCGGETEEDAIKAWNTRDQSEVLDLLKGLKNQWEQRAYDDNRQGAKDAWHSCAFDLQKIIDNIEGE